MGRAQDAQDAGYDLPWPRSQRWNPNYSVPRNSLEKPLSERLNHLKEAKLEYRGSGTSPSTDSLSHANTLVAEPGKTAAKVEPTDTREDLSNLSHWLETLSELYMNNLDNRARWDPRWLNVTHRERYDGLCSAAVTVIDYVSGQDTASSQAADTKEQLAKVLQGRPKGCNLRVVMATDVSRFIMGAIGQKYSIDPEFWFEHLSNAGYAASDSQLKVCNAIWMNWSEQEIHFRHHPLPGVGQHTEWNIPRRMKARSWTHTRWARLGLMHYLGKKGFNEAEIEVRLGDGRWVMERDVVLDKWGRYMTKQKIAKAKNLAEQKRKERQQKRKKEYPTAPSSNEDDGISKPSKVKASNVYRAYSTFEGLPKNLNSWFNRDLRVMAPEGLSHWSGLDEDGGRIVVLVFDPVRKMKNLKTTEETPSVTFMPRAMEIETYTDDELWRSAAPEETYLDPPAPPITNKQIRAQKKEETKNRIKNKRDSLRNRFRKKNVESNASINEEAAEAETSDSESSYTSDDDYDEAYEKELRKEYVDPKPYSRDRAFARKYSLSTQELVQQYLTRLSPADMAENDETFLATLLNSIVLDDFWRLLAEFRSELDHLDGDFSGALFEQLVESIGNSVRQNIAWVRCSLQELDDCARHMRASAKIISPGADIVDELDLLIKDVQALRGRCEQTLNMLITSMSLSQSSLVIDQTSGINKLTELAFFFVPLSFITSVFSMQVKELTSAPPHIWTWGLALSLVFLATYLIRIILRSPSVRIAVLHCRATIINRFSSSKASSSARRLNTVGNRAIAKFMFFFIAVVSLLIIAVVLAVLFAFMVLFGIWAGAMAIALYFITTRWPEPAVLVPCFISLPLAAGGAYTSWLWADEIYEFTEKTMTSFVYGVMRVFPEKWRLDSVDDDDLSREGVNTYARQALTLAT